MEHRARRLVVDVYRITEGFPSDERFGLTRELRRTAVSIGSNIAEGSGRSTDRDFARFIDIAIGSVREVRFQLDLALDLALVDQVDAARLRGETQTIQAKLLALKRRL